MSSVLAVALSFPAVVSTVLLGVVLLYWIFVMLGAAHVNLLGDGVADAAIDGVADGAIEGAAKGALEGATKGLLEGAADHVEAPGGLAGVMAALKLRTAPATVVISCLVLFSWIATMLGMHAVDALAPTEGAACTAMEVGLFVLAPVIALLPTSLAVRPLSRVLTPVKPPTHDDFVGKLCTIRTGSVTDRFGEATLEDGGAGVVVRVRVESGQALGRGDQAVILGYDPDTQEFTVAPMAGLLDDEPRKRAR